jgi:2,3-bisphosphoglycerate-independent phosphoglycerate mutase
MKSKGILIILDGWGYSENTEYNAIEKANTPVFDALIKKFQWTLIQASEEYVGLEKGIPGNSEVGHLTLGAGRVLDYESTRVQKAIKDGTLQKSPVLQKQLNKVKKNNSSVHLIGLLSDGNVHAHYHHFYPFLEAAKEKKIEKVYIHLFTDGRESPNGFALRFIANMESRIQEIGVGRIASIVGRMYGMDRNKDWDKTMLVYNLLTRGKGEYYSSAEEALTKAYQARIKDELISPISITNTKEPIGLIKDNDLVISVNFRGDRMRQIMQTFTDGEIHGEIKENIKQGTNEPSLGDVLPPKVNVVTLTDYHLNNATPILEKITIKNGLAEILEKNKIPNIRISETEKFPHVTFFINGKDEVRYQYEESIHIPSPDINDYRKTPEMSLASISKAVKEAIAKDMRQLIIVNLVNADILGHTGDMKIVQKAVEEVDKALGEIVTLALESNYWMVICGDHGNAEEMWDRVHQTPHVGHTTNPVPLLLVHQMQDFVLRKGGSLANVAPTILDLLGIPLPHEMTGKSLLQLYRVGE